MEMHPYYEEGTCGWPLVFKCTFNMLFPLAFDSTDVNLSYLWYCIQSREDKGDREGIPHTHPIP